MKSFRKLRSLLRRGKLDAEMREEMRAHVDEQTRRNIAAGMDATEALFAAERAFGNVSSLEERAREARGVRWIDDALQDLHYAFRQMRKAPGFTVIVTITLAFGIGATTAIYSVVDRVLMNPVPGPAPDRVVQIGQYIQFLGKAEPEPSSTTPPVLEALESDHDFFADLTWCETISLDWRHDGFHDSRSGAAVPVNFFRFLGVQPEIGRTFAPDEVVSVEMHSVSSDTTIIISHRLWASEFGSDPEVLGRIIELGGRHFTIVGVMPAYFSYPDPSVQFWVPARPRVAGNGFLWATNLAVLARLKEDTSLEQAQSYIDALAARLMNDNGLNSAYGSMWRATAGLRLWCSPLRVAMHGGFRDKQFQDLKETLLGYLAAIGFVLLIVCANTANLTMARTERRRHELATRMALGAGRGRLMRQLLVENLLLAGIGGVAGLLFAEWGIRVLETLNRMPRLRPIELDGTMMFTAIGVSLITGLFFGLVPAWQGGKTRVNEDLKQGGGRIGGAFSRRYRGGLVVSEVALAIVLLIGAGLMIQNVIKLLKVNPGYDPENLLKVTVSLTPRGAKTMVDLVGQRNAIVDQVLSQLKALPGVDAVGILRNGGPIFVLPDGRREPISADASNTGAGDSDGLRVTRAPLREGRYLGKEDIGSSVATVVVNESLARLCWGGESAVGRTFRIHDRSVAEQSYRVVGVVGDMRLWGLDEALRPTFYRPYKESLLVYGGAEELLLRTKTDPGGLIAAVMRELKATVPDMGRPSIVAQKQQLYWSTYPQRAYRNYLLAFSAVGLALAAMGIYGSLAYSVSTRTREIGIRTALGASPRNVLMMILREGVKLAAVGAVVGFVAAAFLTRVLQQQYLKDAPLDPWVLLGAGAVLSAAVLLACWIPARRAAQVDPMVALRAE